MTDPSLAQILAQRMQAGEPIPVPVVMGVVCQVCDALHAGHSVNALHTNIAPHNLFIGGNGVVTMAAPGPQPQATPAYAAPEFVTMGMLDPRADLWSLGVVAYEMLTNRPLFFAGDDRVTIERVCNMQVAPPSAMNPNVPPDVDGIVMAALARDPNQRWQYAIVMRDQLFATAQRLGIDISPQQIAAVLAAPMRPSAPAYQPQVLTPQPLHVAVPQPSAPSAFANAGTSGGTKPMPVPEPPSTTAPMPAPEPLPNVTKPMPAPDRVPASNTSQDVWQDEENEETRMDVAPSPPEPRTTAPSPAAAEPGPFAKAPSAPRSAQPPPRVTRPSPLGANLAIPSGPLQDPKSPMAEAKTVLGEPSPIAGLVNPKSPAAAAKTVLGELPPLAPIVDPKSPLSEAKTMLGDLSPIAKPAARASKPAVEPVVRATKPLEPLIRVSTPAIESAPLPAAPADAKTLFAIPSPVAAEPLSPVPTETAANIDSAPIPFEVIPPTAQPDLSVTPFELVPPQPDSAPAAEPHKPMRLNTQAFMLGPEPTQIGAKPLIDFSDSSSLSSLVGEPARASVQVMPSPAPAPKGTFVAPEAGKGGSKKLILIVLLALVVLGGAAVVFLYVL